MKNSSFLNIIIFILIIAIMGTTFLFFTQKYHEKKSNIEKDDKEVIQNYNLYEITYKDYLNKLSSTDYSIILLTMHDCPHCNDYKPYANLIANEYKLDISFIDISKLSIEEYNYIHDTITVLKNEYYDNDKVILTPTTIIFKNNVEIDSVLGNIEYDGLKNLLIINNIIK